MSTLRMICDRVGGRALIICLLLLVMGEMTLLIHTVHQRRKAVFTLFSALHFLFGMAVLICLLAGLDYGRERPFPGGLAGEIYNLPWLCLLAMELLSACLLILCFTDNRKYRQTHLTPSAIKETVDLLETGICFGTPEGIPLLTNVRMNEYCQSLTGHILNDTKTLWENVCKRGENSQGQYLIPLPDGRMALFGKAEIALGERNYEQIIAVDMTEQYRLTAELKEKNERLRKHQLRLKMLMAQTSALVPIQEILEARAAFHDQFGGLLLTGKYYFENPENTDPESLLLMVQQSNKLLLEQVEKPDDARDPYADAVRLCDRIGIKMILLGSVPTDKPILNVFCHAIVECAANAVKHADGHTLTVQCVQDTLNCTAIFTNDGHSPTAPIRESGGLLSLRKMAEGIGGGMEIKYEPDFQLTLKIPRAI
ncbi:MAG: hypothetical protein IJ157_10675 [Clostridia bacterium]|nr:hypothetical protein [Clostridia bacterium]